MKHNGVYRYTRFWTCILVYQMSISCVKMFKNCWKLGKNSAELLAIVNKHLNIVTYLTKMSKISENLWTNYKIRQKSANIRRKFAKIHKNIRKIGTWYTGIPPHWYTHGIPVYALVYRYTPICFIYQQKVTTRQRV